jgi:hypothetical protein
MSIDILKNARLHTFLLTIDHDLASQWRNRGCPNCGHKLHCADFPRKPRGCPASARKLYAQRLSFDCSNCRKRVTPPSARFIDRRVYVATVVALVCPRGPASRSWLCEALNVPPATVRRWRQWWHECFARSAEWVLKRADFIPPVNETALPGSAVQRFNATDPGGRLVQFLRFLLPASTGVLPV